MNTFDNITKASFQEDAITEGLNMDTARLIKDPRVKEMRNCLKVGEKARWLKLYDEASKYYKRSLELCDEMKKVINDAREPEKISEKFFAIFTPIFSTLKPFSYNGNTYTYYEDEMSTSTRSEVKRDLQHRMNKFKVTLNKCLVWCEEGKRKNDVPSKDAAEKLKKYKEKLGVK